MPRQSVPEFITRGTLWFLESGIQEESGGVARYYMAQPGRNARISTEITGYAVSTALELWERSGDATLRDRAVQAGDFLCCAWDEESGAMPYEWVPGGVAPERHSYFFDCGIIARGLLRLWRETTVERYLQMAYRCGESMLDDFVNDRDIHPILILPTKQPLPRDDRWSRNSACYQLKSALAWRELAELTRDNRFGHAWETALGQALSTHTTFAETPERAKVMDRLHAYGYFLEALLADAEHPDCGAALRDGIERMGRLLREIRGEFERADVCAQLLRLRLYAHGSGATELELDKAREEACWAARYQIVSADRRQNGGFWFGRRGEEWAPYVNPVSAAFCLQALAQWEDAQEGRFPQDWHTLI